MQKSICSVFILVIVLLASSLAANFPFPARAVYPHGITLSNASPDAIQATYDVWLENYYEEQGDLARIKWDNPSQTVSEGIGYGMLIMAYMDNPQNNTREKFDKLWNYYRRYPNGNGLMHWKINGFDGVAESNAATDAELDVAIALAMAHKQWDSESYLNDAKDLIGKIWAHEVNGNRFLKSGDSWDGAKNPSYFSTAALQVFSEIDGNDWQSVINNSYILMKVSMNQNTGLVPDWCDEGGNPTGGRSYDYGYESARVPWRMAWAYAWHGHTDAADITGKIAAWVKVASEGNPENIGDRYTLDGTRLNAWNTPTFVGPFADAGMAGEEHRDWAETGWDYLTKTTGKDSYYGKSLQMLAMLLISGNMPNLREPFEVPVIKSAEKPASPGYQVLQFRNGRLEISGAVLSGFSSKQDAFDLKGQRMQSARQD